MFTLKEAALSPVGLVSEQCRRKLKKNRGEGKRRPLTLAGYDSDPGHVFSGKIKTNNKLVPSERQQSGTQRDKTCMIE